MLSPKMLLSVGIFALLVATARGLECYSCQVTLGPATDWSCANDLENFNGYPYVDCPNARYCVVKREEYATDGELLSVWRGCLDAPDYINRTVVSASYLVHYTACTTHRCNHMDGKPNWSSGGSGGGSGNGGPFVVLGPGRGAAGPVTSPALAPLIGGLAAAVFLHLRRQI